MRQKRSALLQLAGKCLCVLAVTGSNSTVSANTFELLRFNEEWTKQKASDSKEIHPMWSKFKHISLSNDAWMTLGGEMRDRYENWDNFVFNPSQNETVNFWRALLHANIHINSSMRAYVEVKSALSSNRNLQGGVRNVDEDQFALQQGFLDFSPTALSDLTFRVGRQEMVYGSHRLISIAPWTNTMRTWDGVTIIKNTEKYHLSAFATQFTNVRQSLYNNSNANQRFYGVFATINDMPVGVDLYWLYLHNLEQRFLNPGTTALLAALDNRNTVGGRIFSNKAFSYDLEAAYQFGSWGSRRVSAYFVAGSLSKSYKEHNLKPTLGLGFDVSSGGSGADYSHTFNRLYPAGHRYLGYMDYITRQNIASPYVSISIEPMQNVTFGTTYSYFSRSNTSDAVYMPDGSLLRAAINNTAKAVGSEIDLTLQWQASPQANLLLGYSAFTPGEYIKTSGVSRSSKYAYAQIQYSI